jgi:hypothetical protein
MEGADWSDSSDLEDESGPNEYEAAPFTPIVPHHEPCVAISLRKAWPSNLELMEGQSDWAFSDDD